MATTWARTETGDMLLPTTGEGASALVTDVATWVSIKIVSVLSFVLGEWQLDQSLGFPWPSIWAQKSPSIPALRLLFRKTLAAIPFVAQVNDVALSYDPTTRNLSYALSVTLTTGETVSVP